MSRALLTAALLVPSLALAQVTVTETGDSPDGVVNIAECQGLTNNRSTMSFRWTIAGTTFSQVEVRISDTSGCPLPSSNSTAQTASLGTFPNNTNTTSIASTDALSRINIPTSACTAGPNLTVNVCVIPRDALGNEVAGSTMTGTFLLDRFIPARPEQVSVTPGDRALRVSWPPVSGSLVTYRVEATPVGVPGASPIRSSESNDTSIRLGGLQIGQEYSVVVVSISEGGNESSPSDPVLGTPVEVDDFWRLYRNAGGAEEGGCSTTGAGSLALLAFVPFALRRRRS